MLDSVPATLPPLLGAVRLQERAAGVGFDWPDAAGPLEKVREELGEVERELPATPDTARLGDEIGDLLFAVVNLARKTGIDPDTALRAANAKFRRRFATVEALAADRGIDVTRAGLAVLDGLWNEAKRRPGPGPAQG